MGIYQFLVLPEQQYLSLTNKVDHPLAHNLDEIHAFLMNFFSKSYNKCDKMMKYLIKLNMHAPREYNGILTFEEGKNYPVMEDTYQMHKIWMKRFFNVNLRAILRRRACNPTH